MKSIKTSVMSIMEGLHYAIEAKRYSTMADKTVDTNKWVHEFAEDECMDSFDEARKRIGVFIPNMLCGFKFKKHHIGFEP